MNNIPEKAQWPGWETVRLIGRGSFGGVYEIQRQIFDETEKAALKVISIPQSSGDIDELYSDGYDEESITSTFQDHLRSIVSEYSLMRKLNGCTNVVNCDDMRYVQQDNGYGWDIYIKMELLTPLTKALPTQIPEQTVIRMAKDLCTALELCKRYNIIHRDIKPQNIFVSERGDYKLGDFGIAKTVEKTSGGTRIGTYKYIAPEVFYNQPYGSAADIYSLGLTLYWMLNERRMPFLPLPPAKLTVGMEEEARQRRLSGQPLPAPQNGSERLKAIVLKACAYSPADRYQSAREMLDDLNALDAPVARPVAYTPAEEKPDAEAEGTALLAPEAEETGLLAETEETGLLVPEEEATGLLVPEEEATGLLAPEEEATGLLAENEETGLLTAEETSDPWAQLAQANGQSRAAQLAKEKEEKERLARERERLGLEKTEKERLAWEKAERERLARAETEKVTEKETSRKGGKWKLPVILAALAILVVWVGSMLFGGPDLTSQGGKQYFITAEGKRATSWWEIGGKFYYFGSDGAMRTGWQEISGEWYYFNNKGVMQTGWKTLGGEKYFFADNGRQATGWWEIGGKFYYFGSDGAMRTGWQQIGRNWYYFNDRGVRQTGWKTLGGVKYYFQENGTMATGRVQIDGVWHQFNQDGSYIGK